MIWKKSHLPLALSNLFLIDHLTEENSERKENRWPVTRPYSDSDMTRAQSWLEKWIHSYLGVQYALEKDETWSKWVLCTPTSGTLPWPTQPKHPWKAQSSVWPYGWECSWLPLWLEMVQAVLPNSRLAFQKWATLPASKKGILYSFLQDESHLKLGLSTIQILIAIFFFAIFREHVPAVL